MSEIDDTKKQINRLLAAIPYCATRDEADDIQSEINELEESISDMEEENLEHK